MLASSAIVTALLLLVPSAAGADDNMARAAEHYGKGTQALKQKAFDVAVVELESALELSDEPKIRYYLARAYEGGGQLQKAHSTAMDFLKRVGTSTEPARFAVEIRGSAKLLSRLHKTQPEASPSPAAAKSTLTIRAEPNLLSSCRAVGVEVSAASEPIAQGTLGQGQWQIDVGALGPGAHALALRCSEIAPTPPVAAVTDTLSVRPYLFGVATVGLVTATAFGVLTYSADQKVTDAEADRDRPDLDEARQQEIARDIVRNDALRSRHGYFTAGAAIVGIAALTAALIWPDESPRTARLAPMAHHRSPGMGVLASF